MMGHTLCVKVRNHVVMQIDLVHRRLCRPGHSFVKIPLLGISLQMSEPRNQILTLHFRLLLHYRGSDDVDIECFGGAY